MFEGQSWWVIGASEGLGRAISVALADAGADVVASARSEERLRELSESHELISAIPVDVSDQISVDAAIAQLPYIDGVIYSVGYYEPMSAMGWNAKQFAQMIDANVTGAGRVFSKIAPMFADRRSGHIAVIGSLSGYTGLPGSIGYSASKAALMHLAEDMYLDLRPRGVRVQRINPGFIKTRLTQKNDFSMVQIMTPERAAKKVLRALGSQRFSVDFPRPFSWLFRVAQFLPMSLVRKIF